MSKYKIEKTKPFNDHSQCQKHANWMLDSTLEKEEEREVLISAIDNYLPKNEA